MRLFSPTENKILQPGRVKVKEKHDMALKHNRNLVNSMKGIFATGMGVDAPQYMQVGQKNPKLGGVSTSKKG